MNAAVMGGWDLVFAATCVFAWLKGGWAERIGATVYALSVLGTAGVQILTGQPTPVIAELFFDTAVAVAFLVLAIRFNNLWLGAAMMVKGLQLAVHATRLTDGEDAVIAGVNVYAAGLNLIALVICCVLIGGAVASIRQRVRARAEGAPDPARHAAALQLRSPTPEFISP